ARGVIVRVVVRNAGEFAVEHADDFGRFIVNDGAALLVPEYRNRDHACVMRVSGGIGLVQVSKPVDLIERRVRNFWAQLESPPGLKKIGEAKGDADRVLESLQHSEDDSAMGPRTVIAYVEVVAPNRGAKPGRTVACDAVAKCAGDSAERAVAGKLRGGLLGPTAINNHSHRTDFLTGRASRSAAAFPA